MAQSFGIGILSCIISSVFFGSMFVPVKPFETHDGFFVQWVMGCAIFIVGLIINIIEQFPKFYPLAMLGGALWATGNVTAIPIVNTIGMALGILLWSFTNLIFGWASGRFGWFGLKVELPKSDKLNYLGMFFALVSTIMFVLVKPAKQQKSEDEQPIIENDILAEVTDNDNAVVDNADIGDDADVVDKRPRWIRKLFLTIEPNHFLAICMSLLAGTLYGLNFAPVIYIQNNYEGASQSGLPYVFAHFCGAFAGNTFYLICYCAYKRNRPTINPQVLLPSFAMGLLWAIAQASWFVANQNLSEAITFPIISRFPGVVAALWGVLFFKEITGRRNLQILVLSIIITFVGGILSGLSKEIEW